MMAFKLDVHDWPPAFPECLTEGLAWLSRLGAPWGRGRA